MKSSRGCSCPAGAGAGSSDCPHHRTTGSWNSPSWKGNTRIIESNSWAALATPRPGRGAVQDYSLHHARRLPHHQHAAPAAPSSCLPSSPSGTVLAAGHMLIASKEMNYSGGWSRSTHAATQSGFSPVCPVCTPTLASHVCGWRQPCSHGSPTGTVLQRQRGRPGRCLHGPGAVWSWAGLRTGRLLCLVCRTQPGHVLTGSCRQPSRMG